MQARVLRYIPLRVDAPRSHNVMRNVLLLEAYLNALDSILCWISITFVHMLAKDHKFSNLFFCSFISRHLYALSTRVYIIIYFYCCCLRWCYAILLLLSRHETYLWFLLRYSTYSKHREKWLSRVLLRYSKWNKWISTTDRVDFKFSTIQFWNWLKI